MIRAVIFRVHGSDTAEESCRIRIFVFSSSVVSSEGPPMLEILKLVFPQ